MENQAAWIGEARADVKVASAEMYTPGVNEILVKNESIAFNPVEAKLQK